MIVTRDRLVFAQCGKGHDVNMAQHFVRGSFCKKDGIIRKFCKFTTLYYFQKSLTFENMKRAISVDSLMQAALVHVLPYAPIGVRSVCR